MWYLQITKKISVCIFKYFSVLVNFFFGKGPMRLGYNMSKRVASEPRKKRMKYNIEHNSKKHRSSLRYLEHTK